MTRDYAKKKSTTTRKAPKRKTNTRRTPSKRKAPAWVWLIIGLLLGAFITFLVYLSDKPQASTTVVVEPSDEPEASDTQDSKIKFDFYNILKDQEIEVTEEVTAHTSKSEPVEYLLQVASFKSATQADELRARLLLLNLEATIEKVTNSDQQKWHRVIVGPFRSRSKLAKARSILASNEITSQLRKRKLKTQ